MYQSTETHHGPSQVSKINLLVRIFDVSKLTLLTIFFKSSIEGSDYTADLFYCRQLIDFFQSLSR